MPTMRPTVSAPSLAPGDAPIVELAIRNRAERLSAVLAGLDVEAKADVVCATIGEFPDDAVAVAIYVGLSREDRRALIINVLIAAGGALRTNSPQRLRPTSSNPVRPNRIRCSCTSRAFPPTAARH